MKKTLRRLLCALAVIGLATPAYSLTIVPTYDVSISTNANAVAITNAIKYAISVMESNLVDDVTVRVLFVGDEHVGLGQSSTSGFEVSYADFLTALKNHAADARDTNALSKLTNPINSLMDPVIGYPNIHLTTAQARALGLDTPSTNIDSIVSCKMSLMSFSRPILDPEKYDLAQVLQHEMTEVLGISSGLPATNGVWPADLFRYTTNLVRTFTTVGDDAYFSPDGTNLLARYNMDPGGDYGDWWSVDGNWSPVKGVTNSYPQVQDAFSGPGNALDLGAAELAILDVVGWTLPAPPAPGPTFNIVRTGLNQYRISWTSTDNTLILQERTDLLTGNWTDSASGSANPAVLTSTTSQKFYRLTHGVIATRPAAGKLAVSAPVAHGPLTITTRRLQPRQP